MTSPSDLATDVLFLWRMADAYLELRAKVCPRCRRAQAERVVDDDERTVFMMCGSCHIGWQTADKQQVVAARARLTEHVIFSQGNFSRGKRDNRSCPASRADGSANVASERAETIQTPVGYERAETTQTPDATERAERQESEQDMSKRSGHPDVVDGVAGRPVERFIEEAGGKVVSVVDLPDGSGFATAKFALPKGHWIYQESDGDAEPAVAMRMGTDHPDRKKWEKRFRVAARWAIRASTINGKDMDFDPDALVQNFVLAAVGYFTPDGRPSSSRVSQQPEKTTREAAEVLAREHAEDDPGIQFIYCVPHPSEVRLIEVTKSVKPIGEVIPWRYAADPPEVPVKYVVVHLHPDDWLRRAHLNWPLGLDPKWNALDLVYGSPAVERRDEEVPWAEAVVYAVTDELVRQGVEFPKHDGAGLEPEQYAELIRRIADRGER